MLAWIARARAALVPAPARRGSVLVDLACGGGLMAPYVAAKGYRHLGVDTSPSALGTAVAHGLLGVRGDVAAVPLPDACAAVVYAGEILEHVENLEGTVAEICRLLAPGGVVMIDTIADTLRARLIAVSLAQVMPQWLVTSYAAVYVGVATDALEEAARQATTRGLGRLPALRARLGRADAEVAAAHLCVLEAARAVDAAPGTPETRTRSRERALRRRDCRGPTGPGAMPGRAFHSRPQGGERPRRCGAHDVACRLARLAHGIVPQGARTRRCAERSARRRAPRGARLCTHRCRGVGCPSRRTPRPRRGRRRARSSPNVARVLCRRARQLRQLLVGNGADHP